MLGSFSQSRTSTNHLPLADTPFRTCHDNVVTSKLGLPDENSMSSFWRCCCSGSTSELTLMPVSSSNSGWYLTRMSVREFCTCSAVMVWPLKRCQSKPPAAAGVAPATAGAVEDDAVLPGEEAG